MVIHFLKAAEVNNYGILHRRISMSEKKYIHTHQAESSLYTQITYKNNV